MALSRDDTLRPAGLPFVPSSPLDVTANRSGNVTFPEGFRWGSATAASLGYSQHFGIVRTGYETQARTVKASGHWCAGVAVGGVGPGSRNASAGPPPP